MPWLTIGWSIVVVLLAAVDWWSLYAPRPQSSRPRVRATALCALRSVFVLATILVCAELSPGYRMFVVALMTAMALVSVVARWRLPAWRAHLALQSGTR